MDETEAVNHPVRAGSLHLRHEVHEHHGVDPHNQQQDNQHDHRHYRRDAAERLRCGLHMSGWSVRHGGGIPCFVRIHSCPGGL